LKKKNLIKISLKYITNFNPNFLIKPSNLNKNSNSVGKINCKNFILFILLIKTIFKNEKIKFFVNPKKSSIYNILRAPYKNKMSKHQLTFNRFYFNISILLNLKKEVVFKNLRSVYEFLFFLKNFYSFFESNVCFQHKSKINFFFHLNNFFLL
jgi:hypothetical protein